MFFVNDNDNRCISGVIGWDFGMVLSKVFVACVRQLNAYFCFYLTFFLYEFRCPVKMVYDNVKMIIAVSPVYLVLIWAWFYQKFFVACVRQLNVLRARRN